MNQPLHEVHCAWCQAPIGESEVAGSHGICGPCVRLLQGLPDLSEAELDTLPFGVIELSGQGTVLAYNQAEQSLTGLAASQVCGRNFFGEVAPCTAVQGFQGEFQMFLTGSEPSRSFRFTFRFPSGTVRVRIMFLRKGDGALVTVRKQDGPEA